MGRSVQISVAEARADRPREFSDSGLPKLDMAGDQYYGPRTIDRGGNVLAIRLDRRAPTEAALAISPRSKSAPQPAGAALIPSRAGQMDWSGVAQLQGSLDEFEILARLNDGSLKLIRAALTEAESFEEGDALSRSRAKAFLEGRIQVVDFLPAGSAVRLEYSDSGVKILGSDGVVRKLVSNKDAAFGLDLVLEVDPSRVPAESSPRILGMVSSDQMNPAADLRLQMEQVLGSAGGQGQKCEKKLVP
jgi:hypothetical protein